LYKVKEEYTLEDMEELDSKLKEGFFSLTRDANIKSFFARNPEVLKKFLLLQIKDIIELNLDNVTVTINDVELTKDNYKEYNKILDKYIIINDNIHIDLETNKSPYSSTARRNNLYLIKWL